MIHYSMVRYGTVWSGSLQYGAMRYSTVQGCSYMHVSIAVRTHKVHYIGVSPVIESHVYIYIPVYMCVTHIHIGAFILDDVYIRKWYVYS